MPGLAGAPALPPRRTTYTRSRAQLVPDNSDVEEFLCELARLARAASWNPAAAVVESPRRGPARTHFEG